MMVEEGRRPLPYMLLFAFVLVTSTWPSCRAEVSIDRVYPPRVSVFNDSRVVIEGFAEGNYFAWYRDINLTNLDNLEDFVYEELCHNNDILEKVDNSTGKFKVERRGDKSIFTIEPSVISDTGMYCFAAMDVAGNLSTAKLVPAFVKVTPYDNDDYILMMVLLPCSGCWFFLLAVFMVLKTVHLEKSLKNVNSAMLVAKHNVADENVNLEGSPTLGAPTPGFTNTAYVQSNQSIPAKTEDVAVQRNGGAVHNEVHF